MIIDRTWNKWEKKLVISYVDESGNRQFYQKYLDYIKTYEFDDNGKYHNWDGRPCNRVFKSTADYKPNEFDLLEFMYEMPQDMNNMLHALYFPKMYFFDIETAYSDEFPYPELAEHQVTAISLVGPDMSCIVFGSHNLSEKSKQLFAKRYMDFINGNAFAKDLLKSQGHEPKVLYKYFASEAEMLKHWFLRIMPKISALAGWNSLRFDYQYLVNRSKRLFGDAETNKMIKSASPTNELSFVKWEEMDGTRMRLPAPAHMLVLDYMELCKQYDRVLTYESFSLDWVGEHAVGANKVKYEGGLQQLYERDHEWYYFYNAVDSLITMLIHQRLKCFNSPASVSASTLVPIMAAMGQVALTTANIFSEFYADNKHVVWDYDGIDRMKVPYEGAFVGCVPGRFEFTVCDDFKSLYPSEIITCNLSFENFVGRFYLMDELKKYADPAKYIIYGPCVYENKGTVLKPVQGKPIGVFIDEEALAPYKKDSNYFVTVLGHVYKNDKDYAFRRLQRNLTQQRDVYKYTGQKIESELLVEIERLIKEKEAA